MKKILLLLAVMAHALHLYSQNTIIPKAGITLSRVAVQEDDEMKSKLGFNVGAGLNFAISDRFSLQPELQFIQKGFKRESLVTINQSQSYSITKWTFNYLELPILAKVIFGEENLKCFLAAGPSLGLGLGSKIQFDTKPVHVVIGDPTSGYYQEFYYVENKPDKDTYPNNRLDLGLQLGGGFLITNKVMIDIRYGLGFSNLIDKEEGMTAEDAKSKNRVLQFTVGVPLSLK